MNIKESKLQNPAYRAGILQGKAYRTLQNHLTMALEPFDLSIPEWKILGKLYDEEKLKVVDIAAILEVDPPLITKLVHRLVQKKYVIKTKDSKDQRTVFLVLTKKGLGIIPTAEIEVRKALGYLLMGVSGEDMAAYKRVLENIAKQGKMANINNAV